MPKSKYPKRRSEKAVWADKITPETFKGLKSISDGSEPSIRNVPPPAGKPNEVKQKLARETLAKAEYDMTRKLLKQVSQALENQISEFEEKRGKGILIHSAGAFRGLTGSPRRLTVGDGPAVVTDMAGVPVLWYFPRFIGTGLQTNLLRSIAELAQVYRPPPDDEIRDRRAGVQQVQQDKVLGSSARYMTRSQTAQADTPAVQEAEGDRQKRRNPVEDCPCTMEEPQATAGDKPCPEMYREFEGGVRLETEAEHTLCSQSSSGHLSTAGTAIWPELANYPPFAYYLSPGWSQTGMQFLRPIQMSLHFRNALDQGLNETIQLLKAKRLLDKQIARLTNIIQPSLSRSMQELRAKMTTVEGPTGTAVLNGWTSSFPCYGIAINRVTGLHRDTKGIRAGLDVIGVLGTFTEGGDLELPDINLRLEWTPGCLGAFDGYDFRHMVHEWAGGSRVALISFCRESTWSALGLSRNITRPTVEDCQRELALAKNDHKVPVQEDQRKAQNRTTAADGSPPY